jgi:hypothetical protein
MAAGKGCSGARRYSGSSTRIALARPSRAASSPSLRSDPSSKPSAMQEQEHPAGVRSRAASQWAGTPPAVTSLTRTSSGTG